MQLIKQFLFAAALTLLALHGMTTGRAHEIKVGELVISEPWSWQSPMASDVAAGFLKITNTGAADDRLIKATASITPTVQIHDMKMENDVMKMVELTEGLPIPAGATVELRPKSLHIMFMNLNAPVKEGERINGTLVFEKAGSVEVVFEVKAMGAGAH